VRKEERDVRATRNAAKAGEEEEEEE